MKKNPLLVVVAMAWAGNAHAASFDCAKAQSKVERMICADAQLSRLDEELASLYDRALQDGAREQETRSTQRMWLRARNGCLDTECLTGIYQSRLKTVHSSPQRAQGLEAIYGFWEGSGKASAAIYGMMKISQFNITWKGYNRSPRCTVHYEHMPEAEGTQFKDLFGNTRTISENSKFKTYLLQIYGECALKIKYLRMTTSDDRPDYLDMIEYYEGFADSHGFMGFYKR